MAPAREPHRTSARGRLIPARWGPVLVFVTIVAVTAVAVAATARRNDERRREGLDRGARAATEAIDRRMQAYTEVLYGAASAFQSRPLSLREFHEFIAAAGPFRRYPGIRALGFARRVPAAGVPAYERGVNAMARADGGSGYPRFQVYPASTRRERLVIDRIEPPPAPGGGFGLDLLTEPNRGRTALRAARSGEAEGTAPLQSLQNTTSQRVFLIMVPVYGARHRWQGVAFAGFRMGDLMDGVLGAVAADVDLELYDVGRAGAGPVDRRLLVDSRRTYNLRGHGDAARRDTETSRLSTLDVAGRRWAVYYAQSRSALSGVERAAPWAIAVAGFLLALLGAALLRSQVTAEQRAVALFERRTAELRERERDLERSNRELEHFAYLASHDLQEPLRTITAYVSLLEERLGRGLDRRTSSWLGFVSDAANRMSALISDLLEYSRAGQGAENHAPVDLGEAWDAAVGNLGQAVGAVDGTVTRGALPVVMGSRREIVSLLQNLIANGLKYHDSQPPVVRAEAVRHGETWEMRVSDNGIGIDPRFHDRIFGLFQRLHTSDEYPGTGMGLAIVQKLAEANGGDVRVESSGAGGSTFVVTLPATEAG